MDPPGGGGLTVPPDPPAALFIRFANEPNRLASLAIFSFFSNIHSHACVMVITSQSQQCEHACIILFFGPGMSWNFLFFCSMSWKCPGIPKQKSWNFEKNVLESPGLSWNLILKILWSPCYLSIYIYRSLSISL